MIIIGRDFLVGSKMPQNSAAAEQIAFSFESCLAACFRIRRYLLRDQRSQLLLRFGCLHRKPRVVLPGCLANADAMSEMYDGRKIKWHRLGNS